MYQMIRDYEACRRAMLRRVRELTEELRREDLGTKEQESLKMRRDLLRTELSDMLHTIILMRERMGLGTEEVDGRKDKSIRGRAGVRPGADPADAANVGIEHAADDGRPQGAA